MSIEGENRIEITLYEDLILPFREGIGASHPFAVVPLYSDPECTKPVNCTPEYAEQYKAFWAKKFLPPEPPK